MVSAARGVGGGAHQARPTKERPTYAITSVDHALRILAMLQMEGTTTVSAVAAHLGVAPSTAHRLLSMLVYRDFAARQGCAYCAGPVLTGGTGFPPLTSRLRDRARPLMTALRDQVDETVLLGTRSGRALRFICESESTQLLRVGGRAGMVFPAYRTALGLALLATLTDEEIASLYDPANLDDGEERPCERELWSRIRATRTQGFAMNRGMSESGVLAIGHAVRDGDAGPVIAVGLAMPLTRFRAGELPRLLGSLQRTADAIGNALREDRDPRA